MKQVVLRGITWNHSRAFPPVVAAAQRFEEQHPGIRIQWEKRSLHEFGHADIVTLAQNFDLVVIDHPMIGDAEATGVLTDLSPLLSFEARSDLQDDSIGPSFSSYIFQDKLYALPIDAAAPAASFRPDLFAKHHLQEPELWEDVVNLARSGWVRMPAFSADIFLNFLGLCVSRGSAVAANPDQVVEHDIGVHCLEQLREIAGLMPNDIYRMNPIALYEQMSSEDTIAYCPFAYTYSNYSRSGFATQRVRFSNPVAVETGVPMRTVLGGTGIAISSGCRETALALEYCLYVAGRSCQSTLYGISGGQPARHSAWCDPLLNLITDHFFSRTAASVETSCIRPRYPGYVGLQERGGAAIVEYLKQHADTRRVLEQIDALYRATLKEGKQHV
jgi:multiple sugar transport system substrate-binding protein